MKTFTSVLLAFVVVACGSGSSSVVGSRLAPEDENRTEAPAASTTASSTTTENPPPPVSDSGNPSVPDLNVTDSGTDAAETGAPQPVVIDCDGTVNSDSHGIINVAWTWKLENGQACASANGQSGCEPCALLPTANSPQCQVVFSGPPDGRPWDFQYNPVTKVLYVKAVTLNPATFTPSCQ